MSAAFQYRPKFIDIRVRPPKPEEEAAKVDVNALKPGEKPCDHPDCRLAGKTKAPKSREMMNEHYWFCVAHAAEYNRQWDFFAGMSEAQIRAQQTKSAGGDRPTRAFGASRNSREAASARAASHREFTDPFGALAAARRRAEEVAVVRKLGKLERNALADMDLDVTAQAETIRMRYIELVKRCHPDTNGGDRSAEHKLTRVIKAYATLRKAKLA